MYKTKTILYEEGKIPLRPREAALKKERKKKVFFSVVDNLLPPPPFLVDCPLKKILFLWLHLQIENL